MATQIVCHHCNTVNSAQENFCDECGAALHAAQAPVPPSLRQASGSTLLKQRYRVIDKLGEGGFGTVYKVEDTQLNNRLLAAKKLDLAAIASRDQQNAISNFQQEASMLANLSHPNLPHIYEYLIDNSDYYLIMDLIKGETLEKLLEKLGQKTLAVSAVMRIGIQLATVLDYLHTRTPPIVFRDLKPSNIMFTPEKQIYLIDFGIARHFKFGQTQDTTALGSKGYAPPEQYGKAQTTIKSDIYSLGAVIHHMLTGDDPAESPFNFAPLTGKPPALQQLLDYMLANDPQQRPASAAIVEQELQQILQDLPQPTNTPKTQAKPVTPTTNKTRVILSTPKSVPAQPQAPIPPPQVRAQGELCHNYTHASKSINALAWSPNGKSLAAAGEEPDQIYTWQVLTQQALSTHKVHTRRIQALAWSPDGQLIVSGGNESVARVWQPGSSAHAEYTGHVHWIQALAWSPDGQLIASGSADQQVHLWNAVTCQQRLVYRGHNSDILTLAFAPDGTRLASADESGSIQVWEVASGKLLTAYTGHSKAVSTLAWSPDGQQIVSGSLGWTLQIWEVSTGQLITTYSQHSRMITAVAWSAAHGRIASGSKDQSVQIWQPQTGKTLYTYRGHTSNVNALSWSPDGNYLASAGASDAVHVWWAS
jgi:WD40 repeat protein/predicted Ser/Thr protein kinase